MGARPVSPAELPSAPGIPKVNVASAVGVELISTNLDPNFGAEAAVPCGPNVTLPQVLKEQKPEYTSTAMREKAQGSVEVQAVVDVDGTVNQARIVRPLHPELDEQAHPRGEAVALRPGHDERPARPRPRRDRADVYA